MSRGRARRDVIVNLVPAEGWVVDVGADHGHVAAALQRHHPGRQVVATEQHPRRIGRRDVPWVVSDGLAAFREVDVAVIAGMGALTIRGILERGPRPRVLVTHAPDDPPVLRRALVALGYRIDAEALAPEAGRYAEVIRAVPGRETSSGLDLEYGPRLLRSQDPWLAAHLAHLVRWKRDLLEKTTGHSPALEEDLKSHLKFLEAMLQVLSDGAPEQAL